MSQDCKSKKKGLSLEVKLFYSSFIQLQLDFTFTEDLKLHHSLTPHRKKNLQVLNLLKSESVLCH